MNQTTDRQMATGHGRRIELVAGALLLIACLVTYLIYAQGFRTGWTFDDGFSLAGLEQVQDRTSAWTYLFAHDAISPLRRPLAFASFLLNQGDWPGHPQGFRSTNVLIHLLNGLLLALIALRIGRLIPRLAPRAPAFAVSLATVWLLHPFLASSALIAVQRMTLLAATFSLLGILCYLHGRARLASHTVSAYLWMSGGLAVNTLLGTLAKENAALTPLLVAVLEYTLLSAHAPVAQRGFTLWKRLFFGIPALLLLGYAGFYLSDLRQHYVGRPFTPGERLWSEAVILWDYVRQIILPDISVMGPYQDDSARILGPGWLTFAAAAAWIIALGAGLMLRRRMPVLAFAILSFCAGHLLESTIFNLELYFEHRNYLPSLGLLGAVVGVAWSSDARWPRLATVAVTPLLAILLWQTTTTWGDYQRSAETWAKAHPTSVRAAQALADAHEFQGRRADAVRVILDQYRINPRHGYLALQTVLTQCLGPYPAESGAASAHVIRDARVLAFHPRALLTLHGIIERHARGQCTSLKPEQLVALSGGLLDNLAYQLPDRRYGVLLTRAFAFELSGDRRQALELKFMAFRIQPTIQVAEAIFSTLTSGKRASEARGFLAEARQRLPGDGRLFDTWELRLAKDD